jgi:hypothetical protein
MTLDAARNSATSVLFVILVAFIVVTLRPMSGLRNRVSEPASVVPRKPDTATAPRIQPGRDEIEGAPQAEDSRRPTTPEYVGPSAVLLPPSSPGSPPVRPPEETPFWWEQVAQGNTSAYPSYLYPIRPTAADLDLRARYERAMATLSPVDFAHFVTDDPSPLPGWLPFRATPIVCEGREFYSGHFSMPAQNIVDSVPPKAQDWATVIPGKKSTYVFKVEADYRADFERSRFAVTRRRYGWATNRNFEILAAGSVPYFCGVNRIPPTGTLASLPLLAFHAVVALPGVYFRCDPHKKAAGYPARPENGFNDTRYNFMARKLLVYTQRYLTTQHHALYVLSASSLRALPRKVLIVWASHYTIMLTGVLNGLRKLGVEVTDVPRRPEIYEGPGCHEAREQTYAKGWTFFCRTNESEGISRDDIEARVRRREWDVVIISITDTLTYYMKDPFAEVPYYRAILEAYPRHRVLTLNDADLIRPMTDDVAQKFMHSDTIYFKRETHGCGENWRG